MNRVLRKANNHELELKFRADKLEAEDFVQFMAQTDCMTGYRRTASPDIYYRREKDVVRFRGQTNRRGATLTVKLRTSKKDTADRLEIDVPVHKSVEDEDLQAFLLATGWKPELAIYKWSHIVDIENFRFWDGKKSPPVCIAFYTVCRLKTGAETPEVVAGQSFLEVEVEKRFIDGRAKEVLRRWMEFLNNKWDLGEPLNDSLYELYTGRKYRVLK